MLRANSWASAAASLPNETLVEIFDYLTPSVLAALSRVSRRFNAVAERLLYSTIYIMDDLSDASRLPVRTLRCCESILQRTHLVPNIRRLQIRWQGDFRALSVQDLTKSCIQACTALRGLVFLEVLEIFLGPANLVTIPWQPIHAIERLIQGCRFSGLRYCSLGAQCTKQSQTYTDILPAFLQGSPSLNQLRLSDHQTALALHSDGLPILSYFRGSPEAAASVLPGRPVDSLALIGQDSDVDRRILSRIGLGSVPLKALDLSGMQVRPMLLRDIPSYLSTIETLKVRLALRHTLHYAFSGIE